MRACGEIRGRDIALSLSLLKSAHASPLAAIVFVRGQTPRKGKARQVEQLGDVKRMLALFGAQTHEVIAKNIEKELQ